MDSKKVILTTTNKHLPIYVIIEDLLICNLFVKVVTAFWNNYWTGAIPSRVYGCFV